MAQRPSPRLIGGCPTRSSPIARIVAIVLLLVEGLSGASVGFTLLAAIAGLGGPIGGREAVPAIAIPVGLAVYGLLLAAGAVGMLFHRGWGWWLAIGPIVAGLVLLIVLLATGGAEDPVLLGGVVIWSITLGALLACRPASPAPRP